MLNFHFFYLPLLTSYSCLWPSLRVDKALAWASLFSVFSTIQGKTMAKSFSVIIIQRLSTKLQQLPSARPAHVAKPGPWPLALLQSAQKQKSDFHVKS